MVTKRMGRVLRTAWKALWVASVIALIGGIVRTALLDLAFRNPGQEFRGQLMFYYQYRVGSAPWGRVFIKADACIDDCIDARLWGVTPATAEEVRYDAALAPYLAQASIGQASSLHACDGKQRVHARLKAVDRDDTRAMQIRTWCGDCRVSRDEAESIISRGLGRWNRHEAPNERRLEQAQNEARRRRAGIWATGPGK